MERRMPSEISPVVMNFISALLALLCALIGWIGNRIHTRLDEISQTLVKIERDLRTELAGLDRRVTRLETKSEIEMTDEEWKNLTSHRGDPK